MLEDSRQHEEQLGAALSSKMDQMAASTWVGFRAEGPGCGHGCGCGRGWVVGVARWHSEGDVQGRQVGVREGVGVDLCHQA